MTIKTKLPNPWRDRYQPAAFRNAQFFVETDARVGGRRVAPHEYPKRNTPYSEDMGRKALRFLVQGYLIGPKYWDQKNRLIAELDKDGPGLLRLPLPYNMADAIARGRAELGWNVRVAGRPALVAPPSRDLHFHAVTQQLIDPQIRLIEGDPGRIRGGEQFLEGAGDVGFRVATRF